MISENFIEVTFNKNPRCAFELQSRLLHDAFLEK